MVAAPLLKVAFVVVCAGSTPKDFEIDPSGKVLNDVIVKFAQQSAVSQMKACVFVVAMPKFGDVAMNR